MSAGAAGRDLITALARAHGFDVAGVAAATAAPQRLADLTAWLAAGMQGEMGWMTRDPEKRAAPDALWPEARSVIMLGVNYAMAGDPMARLARRDRATLAVYAMRRDYHDVIKSRLKEFARALVAQAGGDVKVFVDTAPVMEKPLAVEAGLGWQGKHTVLVSREFGNWLFLGAVFTTLAIAPDAPEPDHCGSCRRCLSICPTDAFPAPYRLDPRRCISYLTIEHKGPIPRDLRARFGNRVFGCDDCLAVCPWNKFAVASRDARLALREDLDGLRLADLARLDDAAFRALFAGTPIKRTGRDRFLRNVLIAIGNSGDAALVPVAMERLDDAAPLVRAMAVWALARLLAAPDFAALARRQAAAETDPDVRSEWEAEGAILRHSA
ncbi:MAG: tRNA epoxyqueuosine(34) reductase QueG [Hyphomicrobiales bacterium]|uniref:tRNA epoxyqueuosine(34) reductase QueG n=1 Tax=Rhabdaerophilum calidifontis TaxID=2604328 RepID=UPI0012397D95|nr:tRNA epoxyqueuosine(34) reductase QueG [Rhabdaerophilum calidifontis]MCA1951608.1 tRNA epoxyqueuosine(34) reductase QueG [Hyphomicrobiales bacterium]MCA1998810.1 tRNA epoxyqueuosine(34) reductase QueG [Hyphomicrobiales bacterium]